MALNLKLAVCTVVIATPALCANRTDEMASAIAKSGGSCSSPGDTFIQCTQFSAVLGKGEAFAVHLPKQSSRGETCAILLLHGAGRNSLTLISNPDTRSILEQSACVIIFP